MKNLFRITSLTFLMSIVALAAKAQTVVSGTIEDVKFNEPLIGATVVLEGTTEGTITDTKGHFELKLNETGSIKLIFTYVGYSDQIKEINLNGGTINLGLIQLEENTISFMEINVIADRAKERETPVAFSTMRSKDIEDQLGSRDLPMVLNITPSVYATQGGGGAGDARINVRGFDQNNVAVMINGVPMNDMENGWVYWSNWDGIADATSSIQLQRGMSAVNLATPSVGGTMNILTSPAEHVAGGSVKGEIGSGNFYKATATVHSGLINDRFAISASLVRKVGTGVIDKTWTDAWAYYLGTSFKVNDNHRLELFAMGAPQRHGQNLYMQNVAAYSHDYAKEIGADQSTLDKFPESPRGRFYNETWNYVSQDYDGKQYWNGKERDRYNKGFINERENYYHKPLVNLNWYARWADNISHYTTLYYSGGKGGGSGTLGSLAWDYDSPSRIADWDGTIARNTATDTAFGILRNSVNEQWTIGALSKVRIHFTDNLKGSVGIDWRKAEIGHFREVRDLLGGQYFVEDANEFDTPADHNKGLGDKVAYHFTNTVDWFGYFAQLEYSNEKITAYGTFGNSYVKYGYTNHFVREEENPDKELSSESEYLSGYQIKLGLSYRPIENLNIYGNYGNISKAPIFDNVINDEDAIVTKDPKNEHFTAFEFGASYITPMRNLEVKANYYYTIWKDRSILSTTYNQETESELDYFITGMDQLHQGIEGEIAYTPIKMLQIGVFGSLGKWEYTDDVEARYKEFDNGAAKDTLSTYFVKGLKVGDAPQTQFGASVAVLPIKNLRIQIDYRYNTNHYAAWLPDSRENDESRDQVWKTPSYYIMDMHASYKFAFGKNMSLEIFGHIFNLLDEIYVQDAVDNSAYNGNKGPNNEFNHDVNTAEVYLGIPRTFNAGVKFNF